MRLLGSTTSPFVRRTRLLLAETDHEFIDLDIYGKDREELRRNNPALKIPVLQDDGQEIFDSRVIFRYLTPKLGHPALTWDQENLLTLIDAANDSYVILLLSKRSGIDTDQDLLFYNLQRERVERTMQALALRVEQNGFPEWHYPSICLYCLVDWVDFRQLSDFSGIEALLDFRDRNRDRPGVPDTDPRG